MANGVAYVCFTLSPVGSGKLRPVGPMSEWTEVAQDLRDVPKTLTKDDQ